MNVARNLLLLFLTVSMSPGLVEFVEDGVHYVLDGHTDHAEGEEACSEHGCTPTSHHCECCTSLALARAPTMAAVSSSTVSPRRSLPEPEAPGPRGVFWQLERPPTG